MYGGIDQSEINRQIIAQNIDSDPLGAKLTPEAREAAISFGMSVFKGQMGNGEAARIGIQHATSSILK